jgi:hypothetical protein
MECAGVAELLPGRLYALSNPLVLDDRSSWYPAGTTGAVPVTSYLLREGGRALLVDTGVTVHRAALIAQLAHVLPAATRLEILHTRIGEYDGTCNTTALLERFGVRAVYGAVPDCVTWTAFATGPAPAARPAAVESLSLRRHPRIELGAARPVTATLAPLRLLPTFWVYDEAGAGAADQRSLHPRRAPRRVARLGRHRRRRRHDARRRPPSPAGHALLVARRRRSRTR